jgi:DMSO/TMAO reductase YedYZ molybdopterin-dependent catalytic subunit
VGCDARGRKQYRYHAQWRADHDSSKYARRATFGRASSTPAVRCRLPVSSSSARTSSTCLVQPFNKSIDISVARHPQAILADRMNCQPLPVPYGAPLRLRVETELRFKTVMWLRRVDFVADYRDLGAGQGGSREDNMFYEQAVGI